MSVIAGWKPLNYKTEDNILVAAYEFTSDTHQYFFTSTDGENDH